MTLRKLSFDNSVKNIPKIEQARDKDIKPKTKKRLIHFLANR